MIKTDSRRVKNGDIFVCLDGINSSGYDYIDDAIKNGCSSLVVSHGNYDIPYIKVDDTYSYLKNYLVDNYSYIFNDMVIVGITGTNGKTTTAYIIYECLKKLGYKVSMIGTLGYYKEDFVCDLPNTCPDLALMYELLIDSYDSGIKYVIIEASSQGLDMDRLYGVKFDYAIFTNLTHDHLDYHKNFDNYLNAKKKLFLQLKDTGKGIINNDSEYASYFKCDNYITYGFNDSIFQVCYEGDNKFIFKYDSLCYEVKHNFIGKYNIYNLIASIALLSDIGISFKSIVDAIYSISNPRGRMDVFNYLDNRIIVDYAHTPDGFLQVFNSINNYNNIYVVFGCTGDRDRLKRPIMTDIALSHSCIGIITSDDLYNESFTSITSDMLKDCKYNNYIIIKSRKDAIIKGISLLKSNDVLLVLGKGHETVLKVGNQRIPFCDLDFISNFINKNK